MRFAMPWRFSSPCTPPDPADGDTRRALALTRTRLGDLLVRRGQNDKAEPLYRQALVLQEAQAAAPDSAPEDRWLLARTLKSQADLLRRKANSRVPGRSTSRRSPRSRRPPPPPPH